MLGLAPPSPPPQEVSVELDVYRDLTISMESESFNFVWERHADILRDVLRHMISFAHGMAPSIFSQSNGRPIGVMRCSDAAGEADAVATQVEKYLSSGKVPASEMAVMYRTNAQSRCFEEAFVRRTLPFIVVGAQRFYERREVGPIFLCPVNPSVVTVVVIYRDFVETLKAVPPPRGV